MAESPWVRRSRRFPGRPSAGLINLIKGWFSSQNDGQRFDRRHLNLSQDPTSFGWKYPATLTDMSFKGMGLNPSAPRHARTGGPRCLNELDPNIQAASFHRWVR